MERIPHRKAYGRFSNIQALLLRFEASTTRSWQYKALWGLFGLVLFIVSMLAVVNKMGWVLIIAAPLLLLSIWLTTRDIQSRRVRWTVVATLVALAGFGCYTARLSQSRSESQDGGPVPNRGQLRDRTQLSDAELCSQATALGQRMRDFERQRWAQHDKSVDQFRASMAKAANKEEQERIRKESNVELSSFLNGYQSDFDTTFRSDAKRLRSELLMRLPQQEQRQAKANDIFFEGPLVGAYPIERVANLLTNLAKRVCPAS